MTAARDAAEQWFLARGLPAALTPRARARYAIARSAPALTAYATVMIALLIVDLVAGSSEIYIDGAPTAAERLVLAVLGLTVPLALIVGWAVSRLRRRAKSVVALIATAVVAAASVVRGGASHLVISGIAVAIAVIVTAVGAGAVLGWAVRLTMAQAAAMGALFVSALPVVLLTVVVFFNTYVWVLASTISQARLAVALLFLFAVTIAFILSSSNSRAGPMLESVSAPHDGAHELSGTPFAAIPDPPTNEPLSGGERLNVVAVLAAAQIAHLMMVAICTAAIYFVLGLILLGPEVLTKWTGGGASIGAVFGMTIPVPQSLINMTLILCALTFMYVSARSVGDDGYKADFLNPLIEDLHTTLVARNRWVGAPTELS
ncbi:hypothetical protein [Mycolicibacterium sp. P1-5]|uniref:hypothetical protein n=1 Tax=Mycolicibacterium sp. P1-5 TaxID=2024617 RepID=UPI001D146E2B|nr:hypothetical protein [Mycolicibacterium sp. P1-5]